MLKKLTAFLMVAVFLISFAGCAGSPSKRMSRLSINMHKDDVRALFGSTFIARGSKVDNEGNVLELWEYEDPKTKKTYIIYFLNDKVSQWGERDSLKSFPDLFAPKND